MVAGEDFAELGEGLGHLVLNGFYGYAEFFRDFFLGEAVALTHQEYFSATVGQCIDGFPNPCITYGGVYVFIGNLGDKLIAEHFLARAQIRQAGVAHRSVHKGRKGLYPLTALHTLPHFHERVLHHVLGSVNIAKQA